MFSTQGELITRILFDFLVRVDNRLRDRQAIRSLIESIHLRSATGISVINSVHHFLHFVEADEVEPALSFKGQFQAAFVKQSIEHSILA